MSTQKHQVKIISRSHDADPNRRWAVVDELTGGVQYYRTQKEAKEAKRQRTSVQ